MSARAPRDALAKLSTRSTIVVFGRRVTSSNSPQTSSPKKSASTSGEPPESRNVETGERWYGASSDGVGATYAVAASPSPATSIWTSTCDIGRAAER